MDFSLDLEYSLIISLIVLERRRFPAGSVGKGSAEMRETWVQSLGWERSLGEGRPATPVFWPREHLRSV